MLDFLIVHNGKEFFTKEALDSSMSANNVDDRGGSPSKEDLILLSQREQIHDPDDLPINKDVYDHLLYLIKAFFKKRMLNGKNLFKVLGRCFN
jgi:hypothetical protein